MHERVCGMHAKAEQDRKKIKFSWLTLVSQPVVKFKSVLMLANVLISCQKLHFEIVQCRCTLWQASQVESGTGAIFRPNTAACNTCKRQGVVQSSFQSRSVIKKTPKKFTPRLPLGVLHYSPLGDGAAATVSVCDTKFCRLLYMKK